MRAVLPALMLAWPLAAMPVDDLSVSQYTAYLQSLNTHDGNTRYPGTAGHLEAQGDIYDFFEGFGLTTSYHSGTHGGFAFTNVVGILPGLLYPDRYYVIGAHYDSVLISPGADDNASGVAGVLEAARVLSGYRFASSLAFIAFDAEESGLHGSWGYANAHHGSDIRGMVSLDIIAYTWSGNTQPAFVDCTSGISSTLQDTLVTALDQYSGLTATEGNMGRSDHVPFEGNGFPACLIIENFSGNQNYHKATDSAGTLNYMDYSFGTNMTKAAVGYLSDSAMLVPEPAFTAAIFAGAVWLFVRRRSAGA